MNSTEEETVSKEFAEEHDYICRYCGNWVRDQANATKHRGGLAHGWCGDEVDRRAGDAGANDKNAVYEERNLLAIAFIRFHAQWQSERGRDTPYGWWNDTGAGSGDDSERPDDQWVVVWTETDRGQVGWHVQKELVPEWLPERNPHYSGYDTAEKNRRVKALVEC